MVFRALIVEQPVCCRVEAMRLREADWHGPCMRGPPCSWEPVPSAPGVMPVADAHVPETWQLKARHAYRALGCLDLGSRSSGEGSTEEAGFELSRKLGVGG